MPELSPWRGALADDVAFGLLDASVQSSRTLHPEIVTNDSGQSMLRALRAELRRADSFLFSVAFVTPRAIALLKQELLEFDGAGSIVTSDYLGFNSPRAFAELLNLREIGIDVRVHPSKAFHPKGYLFFREDYVTAIVGSSNLTESALASNHEWNLRVSAGPTSQFASQVNTLATEQLAEAFPLDNTWIEHYAASFVPAAPPALRQVAPPDRAPLSGEPAGAQLELGTSLRIDAGTLEPNAMQVEALAALQKARQDGKQRALVISATGTGKTMLSAFDVRVVQPRRALFVVHREQILDATIRTYRSVLGGRDSDYGKFAGASKNRDARYVFATVQSLARPGALDSFARDAFDYVVIDEAHRVGASGHRRVIEHFTPRFLLGMTATPERTDGFNVFEVFEYNVPYEIRLQRALEEEMLCPFHYYGVADFTLDDGRTITEASELGTLVSPERIDHLVRAIRQYGQAGVVPRGLIFCSRTEEAKALADALTGRDIGGTQIRAVALTGADSVDRREEQVRQLEAGDLHYIVTVDVFNEGVDIPSINQVVMLRQTQSAIVFVQQLGRGLRKAPDKEYLVVIDVIGNYANNFLIPIALFGNQTLNKESLRESLIEAEEVGVLPGLSSVRFDRVAQQRVLASLTQTKLDAFSRLKAAIETIGARVGGPPRLTDFVRFESVDPVLLATRVDHYPALLEKLVGVDPRLSYQESDMLKFLSHEVLTAKRIHEVTLLRALIAEPQIDTAGLAKRFDDALLPSDALHVDSAIRCLDMSFLTQMERAKYRTELVQADASGVRASDDFTRSYAANSAFRGAVDDVLDVATSIYGARYVQGDPFVPTRNYTRKDASRLLGWASNQQGVIYGYKVDSATATCPIFVTLHKSSDVAASTAYEDKLIDQRTLLWYTRSNRTLASGEVAAIVSNSVTLHVFVKKNDADGSDFYYLGRARSSAAEQTTMPGKNGEQLPVVRMLLSFEEPIDGALFDYLDPVVTES